MQVPTGDADAKKLISDCIMLNMNYTPLAFTTPRKQKGQPSTISPTPSKESEEHETPCSGRAEHPKLQATPKRQARAQFAQFLDSQGDQQRWVVKKMGEKFGKEDAQKDLAQSQVAPVEQQEVAEEEEPQEEEEEEPQEEEEEEELPSLDELFAPDTPTGQTEIGDNTQVVGGYEENDAEDGQGQETGEIADKEDGNDQETGPKKIADENNGRDPATSVIVVDLESADEKYRLDCETQPGEIAGEKHHGGGQEIEPKETAYEKDGHDQCQETEPEESADKEDDRRDLMSKETEDSADDEHGKDCETQPMEMAGEKHGNDQEIEPESADDEHGKDCETQPMEMAGEKNAKDQEIEPESADEEHGQDCETQPMEIAGEKNGNEQDIEPKKLHTRKETTRRLNRRRVPTRTKDPTQNWRRVRTRNMERVRLNQWRLLPTRNQETTRRLNQQQVTMPTQRSRSVRSQNMLYRKHQLKNQLARSRKGQLQAQISMFQMSRAKLPRPILPCSSPKRITSLKIPRAHGRWGLCKA